MVAEDNIDHLELLSDALSEDNNVVGTDSREGCLQQLNSRKFDLVVLDYNLKNKFSGFDILKEITTRYPSIPVIMVTAYGSEDLAVKVMKSGARDYIRKTLDNNYIERIVNNVRELLKKDHHDKAAVLNNEAVIETINESKEQFIASWQNKFQDLKIIYKINNEFPIKKEQFELVLTSYLADIQNENANETVRIYKELNNKSKTGSINLMLLNYGFKEAAIEFILKHSPSIVINSMAEYRSSIIFRIDQIVQENNIIIQQVYTPLS